MKIIKSNLYLPILLAITLGACNKDSDPTPACEAESITLNAQGDITTFNFSTEQSGMLSDISFYAGTDSAYQLVYTYTDGKVSKVENKNGKTGAVEVYYTVEYDGANIAKYVEYTYFDLILDYKLTSEARYVYSNGTLSSIDIYAPNSAGSFFQIADMAFRFTANNVERVQFNLDLASTLALIFGQDPTGYNGAKVFVRESTFDTATNPLSGNFIPDPGMITLGMNANNENSITIIANNGSAETMALGLDYNEQGFVIAGTSPQLSYEVAYNCQ
ncbi:MAG: hypothetical protein OEX02_08200 [Cyclobacteriaceae bacterium]|nr:hypothetical protein [Cyclobacteriaceae bacterium]